MTAVVVQKTAEETAAILARLQSKRPPLKVVKKTGPSMITRVLPGPDVPEKAMKYGSTHVSGEKFQNEIRGLGAIDRKKLPQQSVAA